MDGFLSQDDITGSQGMVNTCRGAGVEESGWLQLTDEEGTDHRCIRLADAGDCNDHRPLLDPPTQKRKPEQMPLLGLLNLKL